MSRSLCGLLFILLPISSLEARPDTLQLGLWVGAAQHVLRDEFISPLIYQGKGALVQIGLEIPGSDRYTQLSIQYQQGNMAPDADNGSSAKSYRSRLDGILAWRLPNTDQNPFYAGLHGLVTYNALDHNEWINNSYSHNLAISSGPTFLLTRPVQVRGRSAQIQWECSVPILSYMIRPSFGSITPDGALARGESERWFIINGGRITSIHEYQRIYSHIHISLSLPPAIKARLGYQWDFQRYTVNNHFQLANHLIYIGIYYCW